MKDLMDFVNSVVRPLVTLMLTGGLLWGFVMEKITGEAFLGIVGMVIGFWFRERQEIKEIRAEIKEEQAKSNEPC